MAKCENQIQECLPPCVLLEDEHLLVVNKPPGWNTHAPSPHAGEGIYDWLRHREPRWASLAIVHRLDKETSGVLVFARTPLANRSLTTQFTRREVRKRYLFLSANRPAQPVLRVETTLGRRGERYESVRGGAGQTAITEFRFLESLENERFLIEARPLTGRTHQIRVHASERGFPVLGDVLYGGPVAGRLCLHATELVVRHPASDEVLTLTVPPDFASNQDPLREAVLAVEETNAWRLSHGAADPVTRGGQAVDRWGDWLLSMSEPGREPDRAALEAWARKYGLRGAYHKSLRRDVRGKTGTEASPCLQWGEAAPERFPVRENGVRYEVSFAEGYSVGLFLDQRDNRRRLLVNHVAAGFSAFPGVPAGAELLNVFAYTCAFSVCGAMAGARTTSLDLSKKYLDWGRRNFELNGLDPSGHDFIFGDAFDWMRRLAKKGRRFDVVLLDPPAFSTSKSGGRFQADQDMGRLLATALPLVGAGGRLFVSTNALRVGPEAFLAEVARAISDGGRRAVRQHYGPQPPDFPVTREEPAHLKTVWTQLD
ncbi:MAG: pseudouridine synthase [Limisphaerales bacterium]